MSSSLLLLLLLSLLSLSTSSIHAHYRDPRISTFAITPDTDGKVTVNNGETGTCTFTYSTKNIITTRSPQSKMISISDFIDTWKGTCIKQMKDYWQYELCFGESLIQSHSPDKFTLGRKTTIDGNKQIYTDGDYCQPIQSPRETRVTFFCSQSAQHPELLNIRESSTCKYEAEVATNKVCGDASYGLMSSDPSSDTNIEDWYLQISQLQNGHVMCHVYSLEYRSQGSKLHFGKFELHATNTAVAEADQDTKLISQSTARHPGRRACSSAEISSSPGHIQATSDFDGSLAFARVYA